MEFWAHWLWLIPFPPLAAAGALALTSRRRRRRAAVLAVGAMGASAALAFGAFASAAAHWGERAAVGFPWLQFGSRAFYLGWVLDPLSAAMTLMVAVVGLAIFIYSLGYMAEDENFVRFFCFLSLFAAAMLGLVIANSLLLLFICWELVGLTSYLLIGFWYQRPAAAAAAKKAFITTRVGDLGFLLGLVWLANESGSLLFYNGGRGCLEPQTVALLGARGAGIGGLSAAAAIGLLLFCGAVGKSGQLPLHVWLPDAMEGPTPVSALIHAATMVAAGVFLMARVYPLFGSEGASLVPHAMVWVGALTALCGALIAVAQTDIKRILAYSTISQLGYMFLGLGAGGVAVGMFHLTTHAFFKALLFLGAGSVIHACHGEQDIRRMGGVGRFAKVTFAAYAVGAMALAGVPVLFAGFWSKDAILHAAHHWRPSSLPFWLGVSGAVLTAFYMTRQLAYVFFGTYRGEGEPHESPPVMTRPLVFLALMAVFLGFVGTPALDAFGGFLSGERPRFELGALWEGGALQTMGLSTLAVALGFGLGWLLYGGARAAALGAMDPLERLWPGGYRALQNRLYVDEFYGVTVIWAQEAFSKLCAWMDEWIWGGLVAAWSAAAVAFAWLSRLIEEYAINAGFDAGCGGLRRGGRRAASFQDGKLQHYLRGIGVGFAVLALFLLWGR
ncbi:MAG: NADH-quinone oxidoreductase subunit L [Verrucomicrobia bacterium]|nr:NADH-quinone oxidoreductase subunit L [Verrucomicrobiota bacterium]